MNKTELVDAIVEKTGLTKKQADEAVKAFTGVVTDTLADGDKVQIIGFGTFEVSDIAERKGKNPKTGESITISAHKSPRFKAGKRLKDAVNA